VLWRFQSARFQSAQRVTDVLPRLKVVGFFLAFNTRSIPIVLSELHDQKIEGDAIAPTTWADPRYLLEMRSGALFRTRSEGYSPSHCRLPLTTFG